MSELSGHSEKQTGVPSPQRVRRGLIGLALLLAYLLFAIIFFASVQGWVFLTPIAYWGGLVFAALLSALIIPCLRGWSENLLFTIFVVFPVLLMMVFPAFSLVPLRLLHTLLPQQAAVEVLHFEPARCGRRASRGYPGASFVEAVGVFNDRSCELPTWLTSQLREGDEMHWHIKRSVVGFSLEKLERVTRNRELVIDASWRGVVRH